MDWNPTMNLRIFMEISNKGTITEIVHYQTIQQEFISDTGVKEWRDLLIHKEYY